MRLCNALGIGGKKLPIKATKWGDFAVFNAFLLPQWEIFNNALQSRSMPSGSVRGVAAPEKKAGGKPRVGPASSVVR
jgi:hypothetical protein